MGRSTSTARRLAPAAITAAVVGFGFAGCEQQPVAHGLCDGTLVGTTVGTLTDESLVEVSGIAASARHPGTLWMHNDSGDRARVAAVAESGETRATYSVTGAAAEDWEDMAVGPGPVAGESYLYLGDIGDNGADRDDIVVYRIPEPTISGGGSHTLAGAEALTLRYPDGARNAEALFVDPSSGELYLIEKSSDGGARRHLPRPCRPRRRQHDRAQPRRDPRPPGRLIERRDRRRDHQRRDRDRRTDLR